jgi:hypothetical protein
MMNYCGYKVVCGNQFPTYRSTWDQALSCGMTFTQKTGTDAKIYGIDKNERSHLLKTCRKNAPRT